VIRLGLEHGSDDALPLVLVKVAIHDALDLLPIDVVAEFLLEALEHARHFAPLGTLQAAGFLLLGRLLGRLALRPLLALGLALVVLAAHQRLDLARVRRDVCRSGLLEAEVVLVLKVVGLFVKVLFLVQLAPRVLFVVVVVVGRVGAVAVAILVLAVRLDAAHNVLVCRHVLLLLVDPAAIENVAAVSFSYRSGKLTP
jgi:hypothetical protein